MQSHAQLPRDFKPNQIVNMLIDYVHEKIPLEKIEGAEVLYKGQVNFKSVLEKLDLPNRQYLRRNLEEYIASISHFSTASVSFRTLAYTFGAVAFPNPISTPIFATAAIGSGISEQKNHHDVILYKATMLLADLDTKYWDDPKLPLRGIWKKCTSRLFGEKNNSIQNITPEEQKLASEFLDDDKQQPQGGSLRFLSNSGENPSTPPTPQPSSPSLSRNNND